MSTHNLFNSTNKHKIKNKKVSSISFVWIIEILEIRSKFIRTALKGSILWQPFSCTSFSKRKKKHIYTTSHYINTRFPAFRKFSIVIWINSTCMFLSVSYSITLINIHKRVVKYWVWRWKKEWMGRELSCLQ